MVSLDDSLENIKGVGPATAKDLATLGLAKVADLLDYWPRRYDDFSHLSTIAELKPGIVTIKAELVQIKGKYIRRGMHITEAIIRDDSGSLRVTWFNQPYRERGMKTGRTYFFSGQFELRYQRMQLISPSAELEADFTVNTARIVPIYRENKHVSSKQLRRIVAKCLSAAEKLPETLPIWMIKNNHLMSRGQAIRAMHYPKNTEELESAKRRLGFEEVLSLSLASLMNRREIDSEKSISVPFDEKLAVKFVKDLPFRLTDDQRRAVWQIYIDMGKTMPMNRLLEGDVGSGKTVVATMAALMALNQGFQVALMAPTELLANQHANTIHSLLKPLGYHKSVGILTSSVKASAKQKLNQKIAEGEVGLVIGTHALIEESVKFKNLGLAIVDEQHRFGVKQRQVLHGKDGAAPHLLSMTATPIPRSLALTLYGELDISLLKQKPAGRLPIETKIVMFGGRDKLYLNLADEVVSGRQLYVVCPLVDDSEAIDAKSAKKIYEELSKTYFKNLPVGLLHGRMKADEKQSVMADFAAGKLKVLVATTVIEVGVDVPNATLMVVESAERFGLAQLHQLRGRIGRGQAASSCYLVLSAEQEPTKRLRAVASSNDGFKLAEFDLELRGAGAIYGLAQHGALDLRVAKLSDVDLIASARRAAAEMLDSEESLIKYKELWQRVKNLRSVTNLN